MLSSSGAGCLEIVQTLTSEGELPLDDGQPSNFSTRHSDAMDSCHAKGAHSSELLIATLDRTWKRTRQNPGPVSSLQANASAQSSGKKSPSSQIEGVGSYPVVPCQRVGTVLGRKHNLASEEKPRPLSSSRLRCVGTGARRETRRLPPPAEI